VLAAVAVLPARVIGIVAPPATARLPRGPCGDCGPGWHTLVLSDPCACPGPADSCYLICVTP